MVSSFQEQEGKITEQLFSKLPASSPVNKLLEQVESSTYWKFLQWIEQERVIATLYCTEVTGSNLQSKNVVSAVQCAGRMLGDMVAQGIPGISVGASKLAS